MSIVIINNYITQAAAGGTGLLTGLVGYWALDEASGTRADSHSNGLDLTDNNTVAQGTGNVYANCADFERSNSEYLSHADDALFSPSSMTFAAWINLESQPPPNYNYMIASKDDYALSSNREWGITYANDSNINYLRWYIFYGASYGLAEITGALSLSTWHLVVGRHDQGTDIDVSINAGTPTSTSLNQTMNSGTAPFAIATHFSGGAPKVYFDGLIGPVALWDRALSDSEVSTFYNSGNGLEYSEL